MHGGLSASQLQNQQLLNVACSVLSISFSLIVVLAHTFLRKSGKRFDDPVLWLSFCCMMAPLFTLKVGDWSEHWCVAEGAGNQFFNVASFFWVTCIAHQLYQVIVNQMSIESRKYMSRYHLFAWGLPAISVGILLATGHFDKKAGPIGWCWVDPHMYRFLLFYLPMFVLLIVNCVAYVMIVGTVYGKYKRALAVQSGSRSSLTFARQTLLWGLRASLYLVVFVITRAGSAANRIHEYFYPNSTVYALQMFHILCSGLQGFLYALVYINNERVFSRLQEACSPTTQGFESDYSYPYAESQYSEGSLYEENELIEEEEMPWEEDREWR